MRPLNYLSAALLAFALSFTTTSCGDDVPEKPGNGEPAKPGNEDPQQPGSDDSLTVQLEAVDLGLPSGTLWANINIDARSPEDLGHRFAWGEVTPKDSFTLENYKFYDAKTGDFSKYLTPYDKLGDSEYIPHLLAEDDAATTLWGDEWCLPTKEQIDELFQYGNPTVSTLNGVKVYKFYGRIYNGTPIYIPVGGYVNGTQTVFPAWLYIWTSTGYTTTIYTGLEGAVSSALDSEWRNDFATTVTPRYYGMPIRPVRKQK